MTEKNRTLHRAPPVWPVAPLECGSWASSIPPLDPVSGKVRVVADLTRSTLPRQEIVHRREASDPDDDPECARTAAAAWLARIWTKSTRCEVRDLSVLDCRPHDGRCPCGAGLDLGRWAGERAEPSRSRILPSPQRDLDRQIAPAACRRLPVPIEARPSAARPRLPTERHLRPIRGFRHPLRTTKPTAPSGFSPEQRPAYQRISICI